MHLSKILRNEKILSEKDFQKFIQKIIYEKEYELRELDGTYSLESVFNGTDYIVGENKLNIKNKILNLQVLNSDSISEIEEITFENCIFRCDVIIYDKFKKIKKIYIENCIFLGKLFINHIINGQNVQINKSNIYYFKSDNCCIEDLNISYSKFQYMRIEKLKAKDFTTSGNQIEVYRFSANSIDRICFEYRQVNLNSIHIEIPVFLGNANFIDFYNLDINLFTFLGYDTDCNEELLLEKIETIKFITENTSIMGDRKNYNNLLYNKNILCQNNNKEKILMRLLGCFIKPINFAIIGIGFFLLFAIIFCIPYCKFNIGTLSFKQALYFSGITFTTIGYGDIYPLGFTKALAVLEGILGVSTLSGYMVALVNKYIG